VTRAVLDASLVVGLLTSRPGLSADALQGYEWQHAPSHFDIECVNALRGQFLGGQLTASEFATIALRVPKVPVTRHEVGPLMMRIVALAANATAYDAAYIALAEALDADLLTSDARLARVPGIACKVRVL
jgi:predicted nucleic acid-binding protein